MATTAKRRDSQTLGRFYELPESRVMVPSVTHVLSCLGKPALINWAANQERAAVSEAAADLYEDMRDCKPMSRMSYLATLQARLSKVKAHQRELAKAAEIGTQVHGYIEWSLRKAMGQAVPPEPRLSSEAVVAFSHFQEWMITVHLKPLFIEQTIWSSAGGYAGTLDLLAEVNGVPTVIDFKTSSAIYPEMSLQVAAYIHAVREMGFAQPDAGMIVRLPKTQADTFEVGTVTDWLERYNEFLAVRAMWDVWYGWEKAYQDARAAKKAEAAA